MPGTEIITIFKNFPRKHIFTLLLGTSLLISISILGSSDFNEEIEINDLTKSISISSLTENNQVEVPWIEKEALIKRNDSLFTILNKLGVIQTDIIELVNSKKSSLLSKIEVGDKIKIFVNEKGQLQKMFYIDDIKTGVKAEKVGETFSISKYESKIEKVKIRSSDNIELLGWYHEKNLKDYKTLVYFHGNAGSLENRIHKLNHFQDMNINFLIIAWRGFSGNNGKPTEQGLYEDGKSAINWLAKKGVNEKNLILYGESLGTGVAIHLAQKKNYAGIILETPFTSMINAAKTFYPYIPVKLLLKDKFENYKKIKNINLPILVMHGEVDQIVPFSMGKKIFEMANEPKYSYFTKYDNHMMEFDEKLILALKSFLKSLN